MADYSTHDKRNTLLVIAVPTILIAILLIVFHGAPKLWHFNGPSMAPNYNNGQSVLATRNDSYTTIDSVIVIKFPDRQVAGTTYGIKRIVAVGGDRVVISNNKLTVYDSGHPNGYDPTANIIDNSVITAGDIDITVPKDNVYVLGDNRTNSLDSRAFGPLPRNNIVGKVLFKV